jgi:hypothetical protein
MSETIYRSEEGGTTPGGMPPSGVDEDVARAAEALEGEQEKVPGKGYGRVECDIVGPMGNPRPMDHGRSAGRAEGNAKA